MRLNLNDVFWTFQGEGLHAGRRALFVRLPFCNLACDWCDTTFNTFKGWEEKDFEAFAASAAGRFAVITGGEPMLNKHTPAVIRILTALGFEIACETNGTAPIIDGIGFPTVSPKRYSQGIRHRAQFEMEPYFIDPHAMLHAAEFKYVVDRYFDFSVLKRHDTKDGRRYSLSPEFNEFDANLHKIFSYIADHPDWRISLQTHKIMKVQ